MPKQQGDILTDDNGELIFASGDIAVGDATQLHTRDLLYSRPAEYKQYPTVGLGIEDYLGDENKDDVISLARKELVGDGQNVETILYDDELKINSFYE